MTESTMDSALSNTASKTPERFWFKVMNEILQDMVYITMPDSTLGAYVRLLALANSTRSVGLIHGDVAAIAGALRMKPKDAQALLDYLELRGLIYVENGVVAIADERHFEGKGLTPSQSREAQNDRQKKHRAKVRELTAGHGGTQGAQPGHCDTSRTIEKDSETREESQSEKSERSTFLADKKEETYEGDYFSSHYAGDDDDVANEVELL